LQYNQAGGITFKNSTGSNFMNASALTYNLEYTYVGKKYHQLDQVWDPTNGTLTKLRYNTTGSVTKIDDPSQAVAQDFFWNEQQQLTGVSNQQGVHHYIYDHAGERIMKSSLINTTVYLNDQVIDDVNNLDPYTVYVNPFYVVTGLLGGDRVSKHYYMNQQRVATDISINYDPSGKGGGQQEQAKGSSATESTWSPALTDFNEVLVGLGQKPLDTASLKLPALAAYYPETATSKSSNSQAENASTAPRILFWYNPDYLGNVDLVTEIDGYAHEFFMYNPWGEEMHQWNANTYAFTSPYRFNSKELDPETGLAYYGARYYQNKLGMWLSVDPLANERAWVSPFNFVQNNPILRVDPDGRKDIIYDHLGNQTGVENDNWFHNYLIGERNYITDQRGKNRFLLGEQGLSVIKSKNFQGFVADWETSSGKTGLNARITAAIKGYNPMKENVLEYVLRESKDFGQMDQKQELNRNKLYGFRGRALNRNEAGNVVWGAAMNVLGMDSFGAFVAAHAGTLILRGRLDEPDEARAVILGNQYMQNSPAGLKLYNSLYNEIYSEWLKKNYNLLPKK
jgi:RHS repeat-associated protein